MVCAPKLSPQVVPPETVTMDGGVGKEPVARRDVHSPAQRSFNMSRIRGKDTGPELALARRLEAKGLAWEGHARDLPGRPDFVFRDVRVAVFVDGDFWHGWRFAAWRHKLTPAWEAKIAATRKRDQRARRALRHQGWVVIRIWEHQLKADPAKCVRRIRQRLERRA
jgi:DNA mismatch endonuclease (patch repair protein)